jgi:2-iminobutanoate/2-iminopropanoate deaminase
MSAPLRFPEPNRVNPSNSIEKLPVRDYNRVEPTLIKDASMFSTITSQQLFSESSLFAQGAVAGEFVFLAQDGRGANGAVGDPTTQGQTRSALENLAAGLKAAGLELSSIVSLMVYLPRYEGVAEASEALAAAFGNDPKNLPAITLVGIAGLEAGCRVRMDAIATTSLDRESFRHTDLPLAEGSLCHGVRIGNFVFLSGVDATDGHGNSALLLTIQAQTTETLSRIRRLLGTQDLSLGALCRTFMFMPGTIHRPGYGEARKKIYHGIFSEDEFPPNSGIYIPSLGRDILLRSVGIAYRGVKTIVASPKVRKAPGSFSQSMRVGNWLLIAGQDAVGFNREVENEDSFEGQIEATLRHLKDIVDEAGGSLDDVVKTTVYLIAGQDRSRFAKAYCDFFARYLRSSTMPTGLTMEVQELSPRCLVEIDAVALLPR